MPEGPEIRRAADQIERAIGGEPLREVFFAFDHLDEWADHLTGDRVARVDTFSKALVVVFECNYAVYTHNQLYGKWMIRRSGERPRTNRQLRFALETDEKAALLYSASEIEVCPVDEVLEHPYIAKLGPDPLRDDISLSTLKERVNDARFARRQLASLLLDQSFIAGLGNYLRSEIAFEALVDPARKLGDLKDSERDALANAVECITERAYRRRGMTVSRELAREKKEAGWRRRDYRHYVFNRNEASCFRCDSTIERVELAGRRLYRCPSCQR